MFRVSKALGAFAHVALSMPNRASMQGVGSESGTADAPLASDAFALLSITALAEELDIPFGATAPFRHGNDVIEFQFFSAAALNTPALIALPHEHLNSLRNALPPERRCLHGVAAALNKNSKFVSGFAGIILYPKRLALVSPDVRPTCATRGRRRGIAEFGIAHPPVP